MKYRVSVDGREGNLEVRKEGDQVTYQLSGEIAGSGSASVTQISPGVFSVLLQDSNRSLTIAVARKGDAWEAYSSSKTFLVSASDTRDRAADQRGSSKAGSAEIRAHMPGKVVRVLVEPGDRVQAGQGVIVVEAMKMQNEMKSPVEGFVKRLHVVEGATVSAGEALVLINAAAS